MFFCFKHSSVSSFCLTLCICLNLLGKTVTSPSLEWMACVGNGPYDLNLPELLVASWIVSLIVSDLWGSEMHFFPAIRSHCSWVFPVWAVHTCWFWETMGARAYAAAGMVTGVMHGVWCLPATSGGSRQQHGEGGVRRLGWECRGSTCSADTSKVEGEYKNNACQCLHSWRRSQQAFVPLADPLRLVNGSPSCMALVLVKLLLLHWVQRKMSLCASSLRSESPFPFALWFSWT